MRTINILNELNLKLVDTYKEILNSDYIFIPIESEEYLLIKVNDKVLKGQLIYDDNKNKRYSSISGIYLKYGILNNQKYCIIKNDYQELTNNTRARNIENITKDNFLKYYKKDEIKSILNSDIDTLYINAINDDPYIYNNFMYLKNNINDISSILDTLIKIFNISKICIVIKNSYNELLKDYKFSVSYFKVPDIYPIGNNKLLKKLVIKNNNDYLINLSDIIDMLYQVKKNKIITEKYITINGNNIVNPMVINVKKYAYLKEILRSFQLIDKDYNIIINNCLCGDVVSLKDTVITDEVEGIIINKKDDTTSFKCSNCSLCANVCPVKINPLEKNEKCIGCGLCNYICPSKINIYERFQKNE